MDKSAMSSNLHPEWERLSSLVDGELEPGAAEALLTAICRDSELRNEWATLHIVGDALRSSEVAAVHSPDFCARVSAALALEPTVLARPRQPGPSVRSAAPLPGARRRHCRVGGGDRICGGAAAAVAHFGRPDPAGGRDGRPDSSPDAGG